MESRQLNNTRMSTTKMVYLSLLVSSGIILGIMESMMPLPMITPGAKIGLSNIVTMVAILTLNPKETLYTLVIRIVLTSLFTSGLSGFIYSFSGGMLSFTMMLLVKTLFKDNVSAVGVSVTGAVFHNTGQLLMALLILKTYLLVTYLPVLIIVGIVSGTFVGLVTNHLMSHLKKIKF